MLSNFNSVTGAVPIEYKIVTPSKILTEKNFVSINKSEIKSKMVIGYFSSKVLRKKPHIEILDNAFLVFTGNLDFSNKQKIMVTESKKQSDLNLLTVAQNLLLRQEGAFIFGILEKDQLILGRDTIGIQPFYYGENETHIAFASNKKFLWNLKIDNPISFPPGNIGIVTQSGLNFKSVKNFIDSEPVSITLESASKILLNFLDNSLSSQIGGLAKCAIAFSGGLDSSLIAFLAKKYVKQVELIYVSLENMPEIEEAKKAAKILNLPINIYTYSDDDVQKIVSKIPQIIEDTNPVKVSIGIPFYWIAEKAAKNGLDVLIAGQGADELFGGYKRYVTAYLLSSQESLRHKMFDDISNMYKNNLERDMKICNFHGVNLCLPFATSEIVEFALKLPLELKLEKNPTSLRKLVLRQVGRDLGLPESIAEKPKKAIQYSTGVNKVLKKIAKRKKMTLSEYVNTLFLNKITEK